MVNCWEVTLFAIEAGLTPVAALAAGANPTTAPMTLVLRTAAATTARRSRELLDIHKKYFGLLRIPANCEL
jgi:hypothetical protein